MPSNTPRVLVLSGSTRAASLNAALGRMVAEVGPGGPGRTVVDLALDRLPFYDGDVEAAGWPEPVARLRDEVGAADLVVIVTPEYNGTTPGLLVNALDWLSRPHGDSPMRGKRALVLTASPGRGGGRGAAEHVSTLLRRIGASVSDQGLSVPDAGPALSGGGPQHAELADRVRAALAAALEGTSATRAA